MTLRSAFGIDGRVQQLVERARLDPRHRLVAADQLLVGELDRDAERSLCSALAVPRLQHPELALLDGELHVLHVAVVLLQHAVNANELLERGRHCVFHRRLVGAGLLPRDLGDLLRRADAGDDVLALGVDQEFAIQPLLAGRRIAREGDARRRGVAHVAEHHGLHVDRGAPAFRNGVQPAIGVGARVHPRAEHRADRAPELVARVLRERIALLLADALLVARDDVDPVVGGQLGVERHAGARLVVLENVLEVVVFDVEHHVGIHLDEAAVGVVGEAPVAGLLRQRLDGLVVEAEVEHGVHHAGHRRAGSGTDGDQQRIGAVAELAPGDFRDVSETGVDLLRQVLRIGLLAGVVVGADRGGDGEARRHRQAEVGHLGEVGALAAEQVLHAGAALRLAAAEGVDPLALRRSRLALTALARALRDLSSFRFFRCARRATSPYRFSTLGVVAFTHPPFLPSVSR